MFPIQDQISVVTKARLESQLALYASLTQKTLDSFSKLVNLNITAAKASMEESKAATRQILEAKDPQEFLSLVTAQTLPTFEKALAYGGHVVNIVSDTRNEFAQAVEQQIAEIGSNVNELVDGAIKNAPAGSESLVAIMKSAIGNANASYEQLTRSSKQAAQTIEANIQDVVSQFAKSEPSTQQTVAQN